MKKYVVSAATVAAVLGLLAIAFAASAGSMQLKAGDEVYACNCGEKCPCQTMSMNPGNCTCGKEMVKARVNRVEGGTAYLSADGWEKERPFKTAGKYTCACGESCKCGTVSQNPGKCTCGVEMKKAE